MAKRKATTKTNAIRRHSTIAALRYLGTALGRPRFSSSDKELGSIWQS